MRYSLVAVGLAVVSAGIGFVVYNGKDKPAAAKTTAAKCEADPDWFKDNKTPKPKTEVSKDEEECEIYQFAWQSFLYLTQGEGGSAEPRFLSFKSPNDLFQDPDGQRIQIVAAPKSVADEKIKRLPLSIRTGSATDQGDVGALAFEQAGSQGVLVDQNNRAVYTGIHLDPEYMKFWKSLGLKKPADIAKLDATTKPFPPGCFELKSSWRILTEDEKKPEKRKLLEEEYFITDAYVATLYVDPTDKKIRSDPKKPRPETVALVGLHVAGTIKNHPEFIWATFEHVKNSPVLVRSDIPSGDKVDDTKEKGYYTFYRKGKKRSECNDNPVNPLDPMDPLKKLTLEEKTQKLSPIVDVFRMYNSGAPDKDGEEDEDVKSLNASVQSKLKGNLSVWKNYQLIGAVWLKNPKDFTVGQEFKDDKILAGEKRLSNSTMETFTQKGKKNCLSCHNTKKMDEKDPPDSFVKVSHVFRIAYMSR